MTKKTNKIWKKVSIEMALAIEDYLKKPYGRVVVPESDGTFRSEIVEFPGCIATGDTAAAALAALEDVAFSWLEAALEHGTRVPGPIENGDFSGKLVVRLPRSLHKKATHMAAREGVSLNQFIVSSLAEQVGARSVVSTVGTCPVYMASTLVWAAHHDLGSFAIGHSVGSSVIGQIFHASNVGRIIPGQLEYFNSGTENARH